MKTSNKIITGFFLVIFLVPFFILMSFNSKIKKGEYTIVKNVPYQSVNDRSGSFRSYKVVKIMAPAGNSLKVDLQYSDSMYYNYHINSGDSVKVYNIADTVFVQYISLETAEDKNENDFNRRFEPEPLSLTLKLPSLEHVIIDNAEATVSAGNAPGKNIIAEICGTGVLTLGEVKEKEGDAKENPAKTPYQLQQLSVKTTGAQLALGSNVNINQLKLEAYGPAVITINDGAVIEEMLGKLSDSSSVNASWKYVKRLAVLTKN